MQFDWDLRKADTNRKKHRVSFEAAQLVFDDPHAASKFDVRFDDERWATIGRSGARILFVAHLVIEKNDEETIRIISAREATREERRIYQAGR